MEWPTAERQRAALKKRWNPVGGTFKDQGFRKNHSAHPVTIAKPIPILNPIRRMLLFLRVSFFGRAGSWGGALVGVARTFFYKLAERRPRA
jgi:hypothetical protein